jgi:hypothetical protein
MSVMPENTTPASPTVYQLRVVMHGVSPLIWRRLLVRADTTIAGLHAVVQAAFGWDGEHLHRFVIQGVEYGISYVGGVGFRDDPHLVRLVDLGLRATERFVYDYDFTDGWRLDLRLEQVLVKDPGRVYPRCTGGRRAGLPECCGGVQAFLENTQPHHVLAAAIRAAEILSLLLETEDLTRFGEHRDELAALLPLLGVDRFDRRTLNRALAAHAATGTRAA